MEVDVSDGDGSDEEEDDNELEGKISHSIFMDRHVSITGEDFFNEEDTQSDRHTPPPARILQPSESPEELERIAQAIKERYRGYREAQESLNDQIFQVTVTVSSHSLNYTDYLMTLAAPL